jgi:hypothetical protein
MVLIEILRDLTGWSSGNALDLYSEGALFECRRGHRLS